MSDNVVPFGGLTRLDGSADLLLENAKGKLDKILLLGWDVDGDAYFASSLADGGDVLWLMELCKAKLLNG